MFLVTEIEKTYRTKTGTNAEKWFDVLLNLENQIRKITPPPTDIMLYICVDNNGRTFFVGWGVTT